MHFDLLELGETALRLGVGLLLGSAIGFERQWNQKMAGLRTNALVALGAAGWTELVPAGSTAGDAVKPHGARKLGGRGRRPDRRLGVGHASPDRCGAAVVGRLHLNF